MTVNGVLLLDKPAGISSNKALQLVKRLASARKAGHTGSLDPLATGMLPIMLGKATRLSQFLLGADKCYQVTARLGAETATGDAEGEIVRERALGAYSLDDVQGVLAQFRGAIEQMPPMYSALKHQGQPLYKLARQGIEVPRTKRLVTIHQLSLLDFSGDQLSLEVVCSSGTYIRSLVMDIGDALGCGAYVTRLRRLSVGPYVINAAMYTVEALQEAADTDTLLRCVLPMDTACAHLPAVTLDAVMTKKICQGQRIPAPAPMTTTYLRLYSEDSQFFGVGKYLEDAIIRPYCLLIS